MCFEHDQCKSAGGQRPPARNSMCTIAPARVDRIVCVLRMDNDISPRWVYYSSDMRCSNARDRDNLHPMLDTAAKQPS